MSEIVRRFGFGVKEVVVAALKHVDDALINAFDRFVTFSNSKARVSERRNAARVPRREF